MLLQVVALARNISDHFVAIRQADLGDLPERGVRFLWCPRHPLNTNAASLRTVSQCWRLRLDRHLSTTFSDKLVNCWHSLKNLVSPLLSGLKKPPWYEPPDAGERGLYNFSNPTQEFFRRFPVWDASYAAVKEPKVLQLSRGFVGDASVARRCGAGFVCGLGSPSLVR